MYLKAKIISHHNILAKDSFDLITKGEIDLSISDVNENSFIISVKSLPDEPKSILIGRAHSFISFYVVALNIASLGHFSWDFQLVSPVPYFISNNLKGIGDFQFLHRPSIYRFDEERIPLPKETAWQSVKIMIALGDERDDLFITEYIKGLFNLHNCFFNITFINEAFSNFYKSLEYFCTKKVLKVNTLSNEKKQLKEVLSRYGFSSKSLTEFDKIYVARCNEVMHSQKGISEEVDLDLTIKLKIFLDTVLHHYYEPLYRTRDNKSNKTDV